jgi:hypothetical protein
MCRVCVLPDVWHHFAILPSEIHQIVHSVQQRTTLVHDFRRACEKGNVEWARYCFTIHETRSLVSHYCCGFLYEVGRSDYFNWLWSRVTNQTFMYFIAPFLVSWGKHKPTPQFVIQHFASADILSLCWNLGCELTFDMGLSCAKFSVFRRLCELCRPPPFAWRFRWHIHEFFHAEPRFISETSFLGSLVERIQSRTPCYTRRSRVSEPQILLKCVYYLVSVVNVTHHFDPDLAAIMMEYVDMDKVLTRAISNYVLAEVGF